MNDRLTSWIKNRAELALALESGQSGGNYSDACIIIATALSEISSILWPGHDRIDKRRFVQTWQEFTTPSEDWNLISVPVLIEHLDRDNMHLAASEIRDSNPTILDFGNSSRIIDKSHSDLAENKVRAICPTLDSSYIRANCYASLFYKYVRSGFVHTYQVGDFASEIPMGSLGCGVSYRNLFHAPHRRIYFEIQWLTKLLMNIASNLPTSFLSGSTIRPTAWWLDGA